MATSNGKKAKTLPAGKMAVEAGPSGKMHKFGAVGEQKPGVSSREASGGGKNPGAPIPTGGSGKMHKFAGVKAQKSGRSSQA